jgi:multiple antibiotic resistance protein
MNEDIRAIATLFSLVNPAVCAMMFSSLTVGRSSKQKLGDATGAILAIGVVLVLSAFLGAPFLGVFGISFDVFSVAGGIVLALIGFSMLMGSGNTSTPAQPDDNTAGTDNTPSMARLILFAASPGTITGVITISASHHGSAIPITALVAIVVVLSVTWALLVLTGAMSKPNKGGTSLMHDMMTRYMGLIVIAMGIQFALTGYKAFMAS